MAVTPTGIFSKPPALLKTALSNCATFQTMVSAANATAALANIHIVAKSAASNWPAARPFAIVSTPQGFTVNRGGFGNGRMWLMFERTTPAQYASSHEDAYYDFANLMGAIVVELANYCDLVGDGALMMPAQGIVPAAEPQRSANSEQDDYWQAAYWVNYGPRMAE